MKCNITYETCHSTHNFRKLYSRFVSCKHVLTFEYSFYSSFFVFKWTLKISLIAHLRIKSYNMAEWYYVLNKSSISKRYHLILIIGLSFSLLKTVLTIIKMESNNPKFWSFSICVKKETLRVGTDYTGGLGQLSNIGPWLKTKPQDFVVLEQG